MKTSSLVLRIRVLVIALVALAALSTVRHPAAADELLSRQTAAGREVLIRGFAEFDDGCRAHTAERIRLVDAPARGRVEQRRGQVTLKATQIGRQTCDGATLDGIQVFYVPEDGFVGKDRFAFDVDYPSRRSIHAKVDVAVAGATQQL